MQNSSYKHIKANVISIIWHWWNVHSFISLFWSKAREIFSHELHITYGSRPHDSVAFVKLSISSGEKHKKKVFLFLLFYVFAGIILVSVTVYANFPLTEW